MKLISRNYLMNRGKNQIIAELLRNSREYGSRLNGRFRFCDLASASRPSVTSPFKSNTKTVFNLKGSSAFRV
jgi:hypothetical protein